MSMQPRNHYFAWRKYSGLSQPVRKISHAVHIIRDILTFDNEAQWIIKQQHEHFEVASIGTIK